ncbi:MAG TPA: FAD-dependent oxidoreductase, partial [Thermoanaerobaculia bacterium]
MKRIAILGGGINGCGVAWEVARRDYRVTLFEKRSVGSATSSATTKMVHGGLRYLETFQFALVRESLRERAFLLERVPDLVKPLEIVIPHYRDSNRPRLEIEIGLTLYDILAGRQRIGWHSRLKRDEVLALAPVRPEGLRGAFVYTDAQVDDLEL